MKNSLKTTLRIGTACLGLALFTPPPPASAQGIPVHDNASVVQTVLQLEQMIKDYQTQLEQLNQAALTHSSITGGRNLGNLLNSSYEQDLRRALPQNLQDMMSFDSATGLGSAGLQTQGIHTGIIGHYQPITGANLIPSAPTSALASAHDRHSNTTYAAMAASESTYNSTTQRLEGYEDMMRELNTTEDLKASIDLLARITAENGMVLNDLIRMQSLQMQLKTSTQGSDLTAKQREDTAYKYNPSVAAQTFD